MKVVVIGLGSMGKRRIRLLKGNFDNIEIIGVDLNAQRRAEVEDIFKIKTFESLKEAIDKENPNAALVCTAPLSHGKIILEALNNGIHVFTEINLIQDKYEEIINLAKDRGLKLFLSSTMLYRNEIDYIRKSVNDCDDKVNYIYHVGQYLPDWHPWENYKNFFVNEKRSNGCREIFGIEMPWIVKTFGKVKSINVIKDKISKLDLNYDDSYIVSFEHENGNKGVFCVDVVSRKAIRNLEIYGEEIHIFWNGTPNSLMNLDLESNEIKKVETYSTIDKDTRYAENIIENAYLEELDVFINKINGKESDRYTFEDDLYVLDIIDEIEGA